MIEAEKNKLTLTLPSEREILLTRAFAAPRRLVFAAWTQPEHVVQWWGGCRAMTMPVCEIDLRVGGQFRYRLRMPDGSEFPFKGEYREVVAPEKLVHTQIFDVAPYNASAALVTVTFTEEDGKTLVRELIAHPTVEACRGHLQSGMQQGAAESLDKLEELLRRLA